MKTPQAPGTIESFPETDRQAIGKTLAHLLSGFKRDASQLETVYSDNADCVNAFGSVKHGRIDIVTFLEGLFAADNFNAGSLVAPPESNIRVLTDEVVLVSTHLHVRGQKLLDGRTLERDNFSLRVLARQADGSWPIVSEMYMDANQEPTYVNHS